MRYYLDTEFVDDGKTIDLISIGIVDQVGCSYYACSTDARLDLAPAWHREHVLPRLPSYDAPNWKPRARIRDEIANFVRRENESVEFWGYVAAYDWIALVQLWGRLLDLPSHFPNFIHDVKAVAQLHGVSCARFGKPTVAHDAVLDARWTRDLHEWVDQQFMERKP